MTALRHARRVRFAIESLLGRGHKSVSSQIIRGSQAFSTTPSEFVGMSSDGFTEAQINVREAVAKISAQFSDEWWAERDSTGTYPSELHAALARAGFIGICMPEEFGGSSLGISEATIMLQTISESGAGMAGAQSIHANVYASMPILKFASQEQKARWLPKLISGEERTCFGVTEPNTGLDTLKLQTRAERHGGKYVVNGQKM